MNCGIYCYKDSEKNNEIVYIGKDSRISKNERHRQHFSNSLYNQQVINKVLQNNPNRYKYEVLKSWESNEYPKNLSNVIEIIYIKIYNPKFNFTIGGEGLSGHKHSKETIQKMKDNHSKYWLGKKHTEEYKQKMKESCKGLIPWNTGKKLENYHKIKISKQRNSSGYFRVHKVKNKKLKEGFYYKYYYYDNNGKHKSFSSVDINKLKKKVLDNNLLWIKF